MILNKSFISAAIIASTLALTTACNSVEAPAPVYPIPDAKQIEWQKMEQYAFVHFGLNTFNDMEWGFGDTPASTFNPTDLDCDQWARIIKAAGFKGIMLTAKHHDGFCLWPSKYTEYSVKNSPWKEGKGDMVRELSDACKKYDLKFGIYLSPWDRNHAEYGREAYVTYFHNQMEELLSNYGELFEYWFDGANGGDGWYGGAKEKRAINPSAYYNYESAREMINRLQPKAVIFGGTCPDIRWIGNESGFAGETNWSTLNTSNLKGEKNFTEGDKEGNAWIPGESDVSIRPGWFYHAREDNKVHSLKRLVDIYYETVGRNSNLILNFPVALSGKIHPLDSARIMEWRATMDEELKTNLLMNSKAMASNMRGESKKYAPSNVTDGNFDTYWATNDSVTSGVLTVELPKKERINRLLLQEYIPLGQRVSLFTVEYLNNDEWSPIETSDKMTTIGYKRILRFKTTEAEAIRITFKESKGALCINNVEAYCAPMLMIEPTVVRNAEQQVVIAGGNDEAQIFYTIDGSEPTTASMRYTSPFEFAQKGAVKAMAYDPYSKKQSPTVAKNFDIPSSCFTLQSVREWAKGNKSAEEKLFADAQRMFDGSLATVFAFPGDAKQEMTIGLDKEYLISGFTYTPDQARWAVNPISHYAFYVDNKKVVEGEFSNIKNNPIEQIVHFPAVKGKTVRLEAVAIVDGGKRTAVSEFSVLTE